ncbi:MAG: hypothetical protein ACHQ49_07945 [Elusimicrobiota bacterium]
MASSSLASATTPENFITATWPSPDGASWSSPDRRDQNPPPCLALRRASSASANCSVIMSTTPTKLSN